MRQHTIAACRAPPFFFCGAAVDEPDAAFGELDAYKARVDKLVRELRASERMPGVDRIWMPGEQSHAKRIANERDAQLTQQREETLEPLPVEIAADIAPAENASRKLLRSFWDVTMMIGISRRWACCLIRRQAVTPSMPGMSTSIRIRSTLIDTCVPSRFKAVKASSAESAATISS